MFDADAYLLRLGTLHDVARACQRSPASILSLHALVAGSAGNAEQEMNLLREVHELCEPARRDETLLLAALEHYGRVSRAPVAFGTVDAASSTQALWELAQKIDFAALKPYVSAMGRAAVERTWGSRWQYMLGMWPTIRGAIAKVFVPAEKFLERYRAEADWEYGQVLRQCEVERCGSGDLNRGGALERGRLYYGGKSHRFSSKRWDLVHCLFGKGAVSVEAVLDDLYSGADEASYGNLRKLICDTNKVLKKICLPFVIKVSDDQIAMKNLSQSDVTQR